MGKNTVQAKQWVDKCYPNSAPSRQMVEKCFADFKLREITDTLKISEGSVFTILHEHLSMRKLCSKWVPRLLTVD